MTVAVFDPALLARRRARAAPGFARHAFLWHEAGDRLLERLKDVKRQFPLALELGSRDGSMTGKLLGQNGISRVIPLERSAAGATGIVGHAEWLPIRPQSCDLVFSVLDLHWANDLPGALVQIRQALKPDGLFLACLAGGKTLHELRQCLMEAELELTGGASPRVSPMIGLQDAAALLQRAGFALPVADREILTVTYDSPFQLLADLRGMGATNVLHSRSRRLLRRAVLMEAMRRYEKLYPEAEGRIRATVELVFLTGWSPHESQPQPLKPGSAHGIWGKG